MVLHRKEALPTLVEALRQNPSDSLKLVGASDEILENLESAGVLVREKVIHFVVKKMFSGRLVPFRNFEAL